MDISDRINNRTEDINLIQSILKKGGKLEMHSLGYWLVDNEGTVLYNVSDPIVAQYRSLNEGEKNNAL